MHYKKHAVANTILGVGALKIAGLPVLFSTLSPALIAGFLIDLDHFLYHGWKQRTVSFRRLLKLVRKDWEERKQHFYPFHTLEFGMLFTIVVYFSPLSWIWAFGYWAHLSTDAYHNYRLRHDFSWFPQWVGTLQSYRAIKARRVRRMT